MKKALHITATLDQPELLESLVEKLAGRRYDIGYAEEKLSPGLKAVDSSSTETFISGDIHLVDKSNRKEHIHLPFITQFIFTCIKEKEQDYHLAWSSSLS